VSLMLGGVLVGGALAAVAFASEPSEAGQAQGSRVIDRAFACTNASDAPGLRRMGLSVQRGFRDGGEWKLLASASITNDGRTPTTVRDPSGRSLTVNTNWGVSFAAGSGPLGSDPAAPPVRRYFSIWSRWATACKTVAPSRVPLSPRGLSGGAADYGDRFDCQGPQRVMVRVRGVFTAPTTLRLNRATRWLTTSMPLQKASFVVRRDSGRPLAFASVSQTGAARVFTAPSCLPD
jgi:hypothetical protein